MTLPHVSVPFVSQLLIANRNRLILMTLAMTILASLAYAVSNMRHGKPPLVTPLAFVRTDSDLLLHFRVADIWNSPLVQDFYHRLPPHVQRQSEDTVSRVGIGLEFIDSITITFTDPAQPALCAVVKTNRKYTSEDQKKILSASVEAASVQWEIHTHRGLKYHVGDGHATGTPDTKLAVYTASENLFVMGTELGVKGALDSYLDSLNGHTSGKKNTESLSNQSVAMLEWLRPWIDGQDYFFVGAGARTKNVNGMFAKLDDPNTSNEMRQKLNSTAGIGGLAVKLQSGQDIPEELKKLLAVDSAMLALKLDADQVLHIDGRSHFPSVDEAKEGGDLLRGLLSVMRLAPDVAGGMPEGNPQAELMRKLSTFLRGVKVESEDQFVSISAKHNLASLVQDMAGAISWSTKWYDQQLTSAPNLRQLANAFELYHVQHGHYPPANVLDASGTQALYSWRVAILPYLGPEAAQLHKDFHLNESWNSAHNSSLSQKMPSVFEHPLARMHDKRTMKINGVDHGITPFQLPVGNAVAFFGNREVSKRDIVDGLDQTIMIMEQQPFVPWTAPQDVPVAAGDRLQDVLNTPSAVPGAPLETVLFDQTSLQIDRSIKPDEFWGMINPKDGRGVPRRSP